MRSRYCWSKSSVQIKCPTPAWQSFQIFKVFSFVFEKPLLKKFQKQNQNLITSWRPSIIKIHQEGVRGWSSFDQKCTSPVFIEPEAVCAGSRGRFWHWKVILKTASKLTKFKVPKKPSPGFCKIWSSKHRATVQFCRIQGSSFWDVKNVRKNKWFLNHFQNGPKSIYIKINSSISYILILGQIFRGLWRACFFASRWRSKIMLPGSCKSQLWFDVYWTKSWNIQGAVFLWRHFWWVFFEAELRFLSCDFVPWIL